MDFKTACENAVAKPNVQHRELFRNVFSGVKEKGIEEGRHILREYIDRHPNDDFDWEIGHGSGLIFNGLHIIIMCNEVELCKQLLDNGMKPKPQNLFPACQKGFKEIASLLLRHYDNPSVEYIQKWKRAAIDNGHYDIAYLIDLMTGNLYLQFSSSDTDYFIKALSFSIRNTVGVAHSHNPLIRRSLNEIMEDMFHDFNKYGYINYNLENLYTLKKTVHNHIAFSKLFHLDAEDKITTAINYYNPYKDGTKQTDKRTVNGELLVYL